MIRHLILLQFCIGFSIFSVGQSKILLKGTVWKGTQLPLKKGTELYFQNDTLVMVDLEGYNPADQYFFQQKGDTLLLDQSLRRNLDWSLFYRGKVTNTENFRHQL